MCACCQTRCKSNDAIKSAEKHLYLKKCRPSGTAWATVWETQSRVAARLNSSPRFCKDAGAFLFESRTLPQYYLTTFITRFSPGTSIKHTPLRNLCEWFIAVFEYTPRSLPRRSNTFPAEGAGLSAGAGVLPACAASTQSLTGA
jgi:hypothetical protein